MYGEYGKNETKTCAAAKGYIQFSKSTRDLLRARCMQICKHDTYYGLPPVIMYHNLQSPLWERAVSSVCCDFGAITSICGKYFSLVFVVIYVFGVCDVI